MPLPLATQAPSSISTRDQSSAMKWNFAMPAVEQSPSSPCPPHNSACLEKQNNRHPAAYSPPQNNRLPENFSGSLFPQSYLACRTTRITTKPHTPHCTTHKTAVANHLTTPAGSNTDTLFARLWFRTQPQHPTATPSLSFPADQTTASATVMSARQPVKSDWLPQI